MNDGLEQRTINADPDPGEHSYQWWAETRRMIERGTRNFWRRRGMRESDWDMESSINASVQEAKAKRSISTRNNTTTKT
jgi:hypothetical protein